MIVATISANDGMCEMQELHPPSQRTGWCRCSSDYSQDEAGRGMGLLPTSHYFTKFSFRE